ncbi:3'-flap repair endonuclease Xpf [uncultured archaeon]|nr:3'-flap repair endonuclease Xpf [uncultured archaeon]
MSKKEIENIFSKKEVKREIQNTKVPIIVDTREKQSLVAANLVEKNAKISFETLEIGDYLIDEIAIERKTFKDFQGSIVNKRLAEQLTNLKKYKKCFLILEGFIYNYQDSILHENAIRGMVLSVSLEFGVPIIYTENEEDTAKFLITLAKKFDKPKTDISLRQKKPEMTFEEKKQFVLEGFPGIGPTTAKRLLEKYKTLENIFKQKKESLEEIDSIDDKKAEEFKKILED